MIWLALAIATLSGAMGMHGAHSYFAGGESYKFDMRLAGFSLALAIWIVAKQ